MKTIAFAAAAAVCAALAAPASASTVVTTNCVSVSDPAGCLFNGNINQNTNPANANSHKNAEAAYNAIRNPDITLTFLTATDLGGFSSFGSATGNGSSLTTSTSGTWSLPGYSVQYIAVKASQQFVLYQTSGSSGTWDTFDIPFQNNPHALSHLSFFGVRTAVPEPGTWALLILGFGAVGAALRRRRTTAALTFA